MPSESASNYHRFKVGDRVVVPRVVTKILTDPTTGEPLMVEVNHNVAHDHPLVFGVRVARPDPTPILEELVKLMRVEGEYGLIECGGCGQIPGIEFNGVRFPDHDGDCPLVKAKAWLEGK